MNALLKYLSAKPLWVNVVLSISLVGILFILFMVSLNFLTHHGKTLTIPDVTGKSFDQAKLTLEAQGFDVEIQDSIYNDTAVALSVLRQFPAANEVVKVNRTVYLTISRSVAPTIEMPLLEGLSFRNASLVMQQYGLRMGDTMYRPDYAKNAVLEQQMNGERIKPGTKITMGSVISLVLGTGLGMGEMPMPDLFGLTMSEARLVIESNGLQLGAVIADSDVSDTLTGFVYQQNPTPQLPDGRPGRVRQGQSVDLFLSSDKPQRSTDTTQIK